MGLEAEVLQQDELEKLKMGCYLSVNKGSLFPPQFIHLTYKPSAAPKKRLAFIGKGVCFDAGGYNIKSAASQIEMMKFDMGGAGGRPSRVGGQTHVPTDRRLHVQGCLFLSAVPAATSLCRLRGTW